MRDPNSIYVAGGSSEIEIVRSMISEVKGFGYLVTADWTTDPGWATATPGGADNRTTEEKIRSATCDINGIIEARTFWLLAPVNPSRGAYTEYGISYGVLIGLRSLNRRDNGRIIVSGPDATKDLFSVMADYMFDTHEEAMRFLKVTKGFL